MAAIFLLTDGANNSGVAPLSVAPQLKGQGIPVHTVGFGSENAGSKSSDIAVREVVTNPIVHVKNNMEVKGTLLARGFPNEKLELEMLVEGQSDPVAVKQIKVPASGELIPIRGLNYRPQTAGEKKITLRVKPKDGELVKSNNAMSTFVNVLKGGLNVMFIQGPHSPWEHKYWMLSVASSPDIQAEERVVRSPARGGVGELSNDDFIPLRYDVYVLSDVPADFLSPAQQAAFPGAGRSERGRIDHARRSIELRHGRLGRNRSGAADFARHRVSSRRSARARTGHQVRS